jgi:hypothetical protein
MTITGNLTRAMFFFFFFFGVVTSTVRRREFHPNRINRDTGRKCVCALAASRRLCDKGNVATKVQYLPSDHRVKRWHKATGKKRMVVKCEAAVCGVPGIEFHLPLPCRSGVGYRLHWESGMCGSPGDPSTSTHPSNTSSDLGWGRSFFYGLAVEICHGGSYN